MNLTYTAARTVLTAGFAGCLGYLASDIFSDADPKVCALAMVITIATMTIFRALNYYVIDGVNHPTEYSISHGICFGAIYSTSIGILGRINQPSMNVVTSLIFIDLFVSTACLFKFNKVPVLLDWGSTVFSIVV